MTAPRKPRGAKTLRRAGGRTQIISETAEFEVLIRGVRRGRRYVLKLYVTGTTPRSAQAIAHIRAMCEEHLAGRYDLEVVDIYQQPAEAAGAQIIAAPTLVKEAPRPIKRLVGDLSNRERLLVGLDIQAVVEGAQNLPVKG